MHGGHTAVIGWINSLTGLPYTIRLRRRSEAPRAFDMFDAWCNANEFPLNHIHTDNALELSKSEAMVSRCLDRAAGKIRCTTVQKSGHRSRQNPIIERFWETSAAMVRGSAADSCSAHGDGLPDGLWGYNFDDAVDCIALTPDPDDPSHMCPLSKQLGGRETSPRILEINPDHKLIAKLADLAKAKDASDPALDDAAFLLLDQARILEGEPVLDAGAFSKRLSKLMAQGLA